MSKQSTKKRGNPNASVRINTVISGEPALWLQDWKERGLVRSNSEAVRQAFRALQDKILENDLRARSLEEAQ